ncbi:hypothetical protein FEZ41_12250 [Lentilactobacillus parafarraginis]|uniref:Uncharacterized protein n=2 Tax=Lentilactobacillus parafarraginis TaxID=390842 RepID=A0A0R1YIM0_9LACO|nr:hypothetical protein [Lentilactobacillus parafarraginis]KRM41733.1 hypothetical protein FD47_GL002288 [Lentilactobacillus parafarraginis DSM 18390 = JCM 14109]TLQ17024.1 hypothetical protein FEZ41_12250 [Lentilactobacillus parafarraginis]
MAIKLNAEQIKQLKQQLFVANRSSHFVIITAISKNENTAVKMVTDWNNYLNMKSSNSDKFDFHVIRDILPITDNLVYWVVAQQNLHTAQAQGDQSEAIVNDLEYYTNKVMVENKVKSAATNG